MSLKNSDPEFFLKFILKNNLNIQHHEGGFLIKQNISFYGTIIIYPSKLKIYAHLLTQKAMLNNVIFFWKLILKQQKASYFKICLFIFTGKKKKNHLEGHLPKRKSSWSDLWKRKIWIPTLYLLSFFFIPFHIIWFFLAKGMYTFII